MNARQHLSTIALAVFALASAGSVYAQNVPAGTTSNSESGQKPEGGATSGMDSSSTGNMKARSHKAKSKSKMSTDSSSMAPAAGTQDPHTTTGTDSMKSGSSMSKSKSMKSGSKTDGSGDTPVKQ